MTARTPGWSRGLGAGVLGASVLLQSCALLRPHDEKAELAWEARRALLGQIQQFTLQARVSSGGILGVKGQLHWRQRPEDFEMRVSGPFGAGAVNIKGNGQGVEVRTGNESFHTAEPEAFLYERLGWTFPIGHLRWWALGIPAPGSPAGVELDSYGRLLTLEQDGWSLEYDEYQAAGPRELPRRFELANNEVTIKVVVDGWSDLPTTQ